MSIMLANPERLAREAMAAAGLGLPDRQRAVVLAAVKTKAFGGPEPGRS